MENEEDDDKVEGLYNDRPIDRIIVLSDLQAIRKSIWEKDVELNTKLAKVNEEIRKCSEELTQYNEAYVKIDEDLMKLRTGQQVNLNSDDKRKLLTITDDTMDEFLIKKESKHSMQVGVRFFTGASGKNEGAGSRDANFQVTLDQKIYHLSSQAAKYWGLDPAKVFFLDRDGRVVPDNMDVSDIILPSDVPPPPAVPGKTAPYNRTWMITGRDYKLFLVRAGTVLYKEDPNATEGVLVDFTFNKEKLEADLLRHRIERGDANATLLPVDPSTIPSLEALILMGLDKKRRRQFDLRCRLFEIFFFVSICILFHFLLMPENSFTHYMRLMSRSIEQDMLVFEPGDTGSPYVKSFYDIKVPSEYHDWIYGPLSRSFTNFSDLNKRNLYVMQVQARKFTNTKIAPGTLICGEEEDGVTSSGASMAEILAAMAASSNVSNCTGASVCTLGSFGDCVDAVGTYTGKRIHGVNATCAQLSPYCTDSVHGADIRIVCPLTCNNCPKNCTGLLPLPPNSTNLSNVSGGYASCNNTRWGGTCPLNCSSMHVKTGDFQCLRDGTWTTPTCLNPCPATPDAESPCPLTKSGATCPLTCDASLALVKSGDYLCTDGEWSPDVCYEWPRINGTCIDNGTQAWSNLEDAVAACAPSPSCHAVKRVGCYGSYKTCSPEEGGFNIEKNAPWDMAVFAQEGLSCLWVKYPEPRCTPNVTNMRMPADGGACDSGASVAHGTTCKPTCREDVQELEDNFLKYKPAVDEELYEGNISCSYGNLSLDWTCMEVLEKKPQCKHMSLIFCPSDRAYQILKAAYRSGREFPHCRARYEHSWDDFGSKITDPGHSFSYITGQASTYWGGDQYFINISSYDAFQKSMLEMDPNWGDKETRAVLYVVLVYSPTMNSLFIYQFLLEHTVTGYIQPSVQTRYIDLRPLPGIQVLVYTMLITLSFIMTLMELRRIYKPYYEDERDKLSPWIFAYIALPTSFIISMALHSMSNRESVQQGILNLAATGGSNWIDEVELQKIHLLAVNDRYVVLVNLLSLILLDSLFFRYMLCYFPALSYLAQASDKVVPGLAWTIFLTATLCMVLGFFMYSCFGWGSPAFSTPASCLMSVVHYAQGGIRNWEEFYWLYPHVWRLLITIGAMLLCVVLKGLPTAILFSHKKEMTLRKEYSYHPCWTGQYDIPNGFNPGRGGLRWDEWDKHRNRRKEAYKPREDKRLIEQKRGLWNGEHAMMGDDD